MLCDKYIVIRYIIFIKGLINSIDVKYVKIKKNLKVCKFLIVCEIFKLFFISFKILFW